MSNPTIPSVRLFVGSDAAGAGVLLLAQADKLNAAPDDGAGDPSYLGLFGLLLARARVSQENLTLSLAAVTAAETALDKKVKAAHDQETAMEKACSALHAGLIAEVKAGTDGAEEELALLFPDGLTPVTRPSGRSQVTSCEALLQVLASAAAMSNPIYAVILGKVDTFRDQAAAFTQAIQDKDAQETDLDKARKARDKHQGTWTDTFRRLIEAGARLHGEDSVTFRGWVRPLLARRSNQDALHTRQANAQAPAEPPAEAPAVTEAPTQGSEEPSAA